MVVNFHGYIRATGDIDIWLAPTNENKFNFCNVLLEIGYTKDEISAIIKQDFTSHFMCKVWLDNNMSVNFLTIVHKDLDFVKSFKESTSFMLTDDVKVFIVSYNYLKEMKLRSNRLKDLQDINKLEEIKNNLNK